MSTSAPARKIFGISARTLFRFGLVAIALAGLGWLVSWLAGRSLMSPTRKRAMQAWLDENLNADVSLGGPMRVRLNLVRRSRIALNDVEIEHPNPIFLGKFAIIGAVGAWIPPWAAARLWPGRLDLRFRDLRLFVEENESGEWNIDGLMRPLAVGEGGFPFPMPKISGWTAGFEDSRLSIRRHGYEMALELVADVSGAPGSEVVSLRAGRMPFAFSRIGEGGKRTGSIGPGGLTARFGENARASWHLVPGQCNLEVEALPAEIALFLVPGIPLENVPGTFGGRISVRESDEAAGMIRLDGELRDVPLAVFGLPRTAPISLSWPISPEKDGTTARMRMGPSGFGAFAIEIPLDETGAPKMLSMRGDVAALDDLPELLASHSRWPDWLARTFPFIEWRTGKWLGFGWAGDDMRLNLVRSTAGLNLTGEAGLMGGRIRIALSPGKNDAPVTIAAEKLDAQLLGVKLSQLLPSAFRTHMSGANANFTWQGRRREDGEIDEWSGGMVFANPVFDLKNGGEWWRRLKDIEKALVSALPEWGGGDGSGLAELAEKDVIELDQLSLVMEKKRDGLVSVEFRAYGDAPGQATGWIESHPDGYVEGEIYLAGESDLLREVGNANPTLGRALVILADDSLGLRVVFRISPGEAPAFQFPFLDEARLVHEILTENSDPEASEGGGANVP